MKKKILITTFNFPYPLTHGGAIAQYYFLEQLSRLYDITILTISNSDDQTNQFNELLVKQPLVKLIIFDNFKTEQKNEILLFPYKILKGVINRYERHYKYGFSIPFIEQEFLNFLLKHLKENKYDFYQCEFVETLPLLRIFKKFGKVIFIHHELMSKRLENDRISSSRLIDKVLGYEKKVLANADEVVVFNNDDKERLEKYLKRVTVVPFGIPEIEITKVKCSTKFSKFLFIGGDNQNLVCDYISLINPYDFTQFENLQIPDFNLSIQNKRSETNVLNTYLMFWKIQLCDNVRVNYEKKNDIKFDFVMRIRPDLFFFKRLPKIILISLKFNLINYYIPYFPWRVNKYALADFFAFGKPEKMQYYSSVYENIQKYIDKGIVFHPETLLGYHIKNTFKTSGYRTICRLSGSEIHLNGYRQ